MHLTTLTADIEARTGIKRIAQGVFVVLLTSNAMLAGWVVTRDTTTRTQLVPPAIGKGFWVDGKHLDPDYLEQMADFLITNFASVTPLSVDQQNDLLLKYVHPSVFGTLQVTWKISANKLKTDNVSRLFYKREVRIDPAEQAVAYIGLEDTWVADKKMPEPALKAYMVRFDVSGGRTTIRELCETSPDKPFVPLAQSGATSGP
jgi:type IV conjugative transfer system protein TraE